MRTAGIDFARAFHCGWSSAFFPHLLKDSEKILGKPFAVIDNDRTNYSLCALFFA
jgi:hypothetical protein